MVSVIMAVYNGGEYLRQAVKSILEQRYNDFEFIIIDDASTDDTSSLLVSFNDPRIKIFKNKVNYGLTKSLNKALALAKGKFVARMDADDISHPDRFQRQVDFLNSNNHIGLCGTWAKIFGNKTLEIKYPVLHNDIKFAMLQYNPFFHPSVMWRAGLDLKYNEHYRTAQDYELFSRIVEITETANLPEVLLYYREHNKQVTKQRSASQEEASRKIKYRQVSHMQLQPTPEELTTHLSLFDGSANPVGTYNIREADNWLYKFFIANQKLNVYDQQLLLNFWKRKLFVDNIKKYDLKLWGIFRSSSLRKFSAKLLWKVKFFIKCLLGWKVSTN